MTSYCVTTVFTTPTISPYTSNIITNPFIQACILYPLPSPSFSPLPPPSLPFPLLPPSLPLLPPSLPPPPPSLPPPPPSLPPPPPSLSPPPLPPPPSPLPPPSSPQYGLTRMLQSEQGLITFVMAMDPYNENMMADVLRVTAAVCLVADG